MHCNMNNNNNLNTYKIKFKKKNAFKAIKKYKQILEILNVRKKNCNLDYIACYTTYRKQKYISYCCCYSNRKKNFRDVY